MATSIGNDISNPDTLSAVAPSTPAPVSSPMLDTLVCLPPMVREARDEAISAIIAAFPNACPQIAVTELDTQNSYTTKAQLTAYDEVRSQSDWALQAADYLAAGNLARRHQKRYVILLGSDIPSVTLLQGLAREITQGHADMVIPRLQSGPNGGLVNSALIYPMTRALFGQDIRFPLPHNIALSQRANDRLTSEAQREVTAGKGDSLLWPVSVATAAGLSLRQIDTDDQLPSPHIADFNRLFTEVIGSLLADTEARAIYWQRSRYLAPAASIPPPSASPSIEAGADVVSMVEGFRVAYANLLPIWSLVLPPQSLLALKKLAPTSPQTFQFPPELWARIVYDFALAFHLRTLNRSHLLGALTPLYLAWAASHIRSSAGDPKAADRLSNETASAFETEKPYFVSRWRWPDRFNP